MGNPMMQAQNVTPGMKIAFDIMGDTVCITPHEVKVNDFTYEFWSNATPRIIVEPWTMVEVLSAPVPEPLIIGSRVLAGDRAFLHVQSAVPTAGSWVDIVNGSRYTWSMLRDRFGPITVLDDNPGWTVDSRKTEPETVESLDDADPELFYRDGNGDLWAQDEYQPYRWLLHVPDYETRDSSKVGHFFPAARKVNKQYSGALSIVWYTVRRIKHRFDRSHTIVICAVPCLRPETRWHRVSARVPRVRRGSTYRDQRAHGVSAGS